MYRFFNNTLFVSSGDSFATQSVSGAINQLCKIQSTSFGINFQHKPVPFLNSDYQCTQTEPPIANLNFEYLATNGLNERLMGFFTNITGNAFSKLNNTKNYYILVGEDATQTNLYNGTNPSNYKTIAFGNTLMDSWNLNAQVGALPNASVSLTALNIFLHTGLPSGQSSPTVNLNGNSDGQTYILPFATQNPTGSISNPVNFISALGPQDIILEFPTGSIFASFISGSNSVLLQSFNLGVTFPRQNIKNLGDVYPERPLQFPIEISLSTTAIVNKYKRDELNKVNCGNTGHNINIILRRPCSDEIAMELRLKNLYLESQNYSTAIGGYTSTNMNWRGYLYNFNTGISNFSIYAGQGTEYYILENCIDITGYDAFGQPIIEQECFWRRETLENKS